MSTDSSGQQGTYATVYACHVLASVMIMDDEDRAPIDSRGYDNAYEVVAARLERRIRSGEFGYHMPLPSEPALAEHYGLARSTIRRGIALLADKGMVEVRRGKGTYVTWQPGE
jgi:GntR family transcriptional regulator